MLAKIISILGYAIVEIVVAVINEGEEAGA